MKVEAQKTKFTDACLRIVGKDGKILDDFELSSVASLADLTLNSADVGQLSDPMKTLLQNTFRSLAKALQDAKFFEDPTMEATVSKVASAADALTRSLGLLDDHFKRECKAISLHVGLHLAAKQVRDYPDIAAFLEADKKDDKFARKLLQAWRACNEAGKDFNLLTPVRNSAWSLLCKIVEQKQQQMDASLLKEAGSLAEIQGGRDEGASWKENLADDAPWKDVVTAAKRHLFLEHKGKQLQTVFKKVSQVCSLCGHNQYAVKLLTSQQLSSSYTRESI